MKPGRRQTERYKFRGTWNSVVVGSDRPGEHKDGTPIVKRQKGTRRHKADWKR